MNSNLKTVLSLLKSEKVKERQEGIASLREVFKRDSVVETLDDVGDGRAWLVLFQALFTAVINEKAACTKKNIADAGQAALRRLGEAASAVRWLTERSVARLNKKVVKPLLSHLLQTLVYQGELLIPVSLDYIKAIRCLLSFAPHLDHLESDQWVKILSLAFAAILGDSLRSSLEDEEDSVSPGPDELDDDMYEDDSPSGSSSPKKRRRRASTSTLQPAPSIPVKHRPVSLEQIEFMALIAILLRFSGAPLLSPDYPCLARNVLTQLRRFFCTFPKDTSAHQDAVLAVNSALGHLALNARDEVSLFGAKIWDSLLSLWGTKNRHMKDALVISLRILFPFVTQDEENSSNVDGINRLYKILDGEAESRWGVDGLSFDALRLEIASDDDELRAFEARTFRHGFHFDNDQALTWSILELQADCAKKLFRLSENIHSIASSSGSNKRARLFENPITSLLGSIRMQSATKVRSYHMQILLFVIDRHWSVLHDELQQDVINTLLQYLSFDDGVIQSWSFLCFAAISSADGARTRQSSVWDSVWTHAMRRVNVPNVCRAACHAAHALLSHARLSSSQRVLSEIEALSKDLDVQGPSFPFDSACVFLSQCLRVASQDMRLYRMQLEEKVLSWLMENWQILDSAVKHYAGKSRLPPHTVRDILMLLESICVLPRRSDLICRTLLPDCAIAEALVEERKAAVIRDFLLDARLPSFRKRPKEKVRSPLLSSGIKESDHELAQPRGRERKVSAFLLKFLELLAIEWEPSKDSNTHPTAERVRRSLDIVVVALTFEALLNLNGTRSNRRVLQAACKVISLVSPFLRQSRWTNEERVLIVLGLEPLVSVGQESFTGTEVMLPPGPCTGVKGRTVSDLMRGRGYDLQQLYASRRQLQRLVWQSTDVQDVFQLVMRALKDVLRSVLGINSPDVSPALEADQKDDFAAVRTSQSVARPSESIQQRNDANSLQSVVEICVTFLARAPILQSSSEDATRDKDLADIILRCNGDQLLLLGPSYFDNVRHGTLNLSVTGLDKFLDHLELLLTQYRHAREARMLWFSIHFLDSTSSLWLQPSISRSQAGEHIRALCRWLSQALSTKKIRSWTTRDYLVRFFDRYLCQDPNQDFWSIQSSEEDEEPDPKSQPQALLPTMARDEDIRVRIRSAVGTARLFSSCSSRNLDVMLLYEYVRLQLCTAVENYEHMITRILCLGNILTVSSAVRRGPYWHLLETCFHCSNYVRHLEAILKGAAERMGLSNIAQLFEAYASQIAFSIRVAGKDFLKLPPHLLGYQSDKDRAEAAFRPFSKTNLLAHGQPSAIEHGKKLFSSHCVALQKIETDGLRECFTDIAACQIVTWIDAHMAPSDRVVQLSQEMTESLGLVLEKRAADLKLDKGLNDYMKRNADSIMVAILCALGDQDYSSSGPIHQAIEGIDGTGRNAHIFRALTVYRKHDDFEMHAPNLPAFSSVTVLGALQWFSGHIQDSNAHATVYHVLHQLFAEAGHSPLINEQIRLMNCICIWTMYHHSRFQDATLLRTLVNGATMLLSQASLARAAQSILEWALHIYKTDSLKEPRFSDMIVRIACIAHEFSSVVEDPDIAALGVDLLKWIETLALEFSLVAFLQPQIVHALSAWPKEPCEELSLISDTVAPHILSAILNDTRLSSNKFRLVRRLRNLAIANQSNLSMREQFALSDFWRLKECIPPIEKLQPGDVDAFASLLVLHSGQIKSISSEPLNAMSLRAQHARAGRKRVTDQNNSPTSPKRAIILALLSMLDADSAPQVRVTYHTLRKLLSVTSRDVMTSRSWLPEHRAELTYLKTFSARPDIRPRCDAFSALKSDSYLEMTSDFPKWISTITVLLSDILAETDPFYAQLASLLQVDVTFSEQILPVLVHTVLESTHTQGVTVANGDFSLRLCLSAYLSMSLAFPRVSTPCVRSVVDTVLHLRNFHRETDDALAHDKWLDIDYMLLSESAIVCGAYTTALLFLELAAEYGHRSGANDSVAEKVLFDIYDHIEEPDGFYGIRTKDLNQFLIRRFHHEQQWEKAFQFHGAALEAGHLVAGHTEGILQSLHAFGFDKLAINTMQSPPGTIGSDTSLTDMSYHLGWRSETWDLPDQSTPRSSEAALYVVLRAIHRERDQTVADETLSLALREQVHRLSSLADESLMEIRQVTRNLMCLSQTAQWRSSDIQVALQTKMIDSAGWENFWNIDPNFDFSDLESIMATRIALIRTARQREEREQIGNMMTPFSMGLIDIEKKCLVRLSDAARNSNHLQVALNSIVRAQRLEHAASFDVSQEFASVLWSQKEQKLAVQYLKDLITDGQRQTTSRSESSEERALLLARLGTWTSEACLEKPVFIRKEFFDPAIALVGNEGTPHNSRSHADLFHQYAVFAERQYHAILKSPDAVRWKVYIDRKKEEIQRRNEQLRKTPIGTKEQLDIIQDQRRAQTLLEEDMAQFKHHNGARDAFLEQAVDMLSRCLSVSDDYDDDGAIRLCSLWFSNFDNDGLQEHVRVALNRIPSRKLVFLAHQLSARLSISHGPQPPANQANLQMLMIQMCKEHPFHSLQQVFCLLGDQPMPSASRRQSGRNETASSQNDRASAARQIFDSLRADLVTGERVRNVELICNASLEWAKFPIKRDPIYNPKKHRGPFEVPAQMMIRKIKNLGVPVVTVHTPLDPTMQYQDCVWIDHYDEHFETAGGLNLPKISVCYGSDGNKYKQLFKGEDGDDLRQDAVMEQVFGLVNIILRRDRETRKRNLRIRGYKVIPLAPQAGLLEFVGNTTVLQPWLLQAHSKYRPTDMKNFECNNMMNIGKKFKDPKARADAFVPLLKQIRERFKPVMRHYFTERSKVPMSWFAMRLDYARSVATTSIVGHILGLGDRHTSNILMDNGTGEVVHIDLGIAFDQGKLLPIPERVPFRMTADMVDGLGTTGTQGVFQRCAEETLRVLRDDSEIIMTVLEVFKHDPLQSWTASEVKVKRVQGTTSDSAQAFQDTARFGLGIDMTSGTAEEAADRALNSVARKLDKGMSVEYTVNELIAEATDIANLAAIFPGWCPWL